MSQRQDMTEEPKRDAVSPSKEEGRKAYQPPRVESGDIFERIVLESGSDPNEEDC